MNGQPPRDPKNIMKDAYLKRWLPIWHHNAMENYPQIKKDFGYQELPDEVFKVTKNSCVTSLGTNNNRPALILGSGPSLDGIHDIIKNWKHPIFASASNAFVPIRFGRAPEYICAYDSHWSVFRQLQLDFYKWDKSILITHPYATPKMLKKWKGKKLYYRRYYVGMEFSEVILPLMYPWIKIGFRVTGSVVNNAVSIAKYWGFSPIFLIGVDLGFRDDKKPKGRFFWPTKKGDWEELPIKPREDEPLIYENNLKTNPGFINFKEALLQIWKGENANIIDCSNGILTELPHANIKDVIEKQGFGFDHLLKKPEEVKVIVDNYFKYGHTKVKKPVSAKKVATAKTSFTGFFSLLELAEKHKVDKLNPHKYIEIYEKYFNSTRKTVTKVFEIGIHRGASHRMWEEYFAEAKIYGIDIRLYCLEVKSERIIPFLAFQDNRLQLANFIKIHGKDFDIIIDDGSHRWGDQQTCFGYFFKYLKNGGIYVIEDLHTSKEEHYNTPIKSKHHTLQIVEQLSKGELPKSDFITKEEMDYIMENMEFCKIEKGAKSEIAFIKHK